MSLQKFKGRKDGKLPSFCLNVFILSKVEIEVLYLDQKKGGMLNVE